MPKQKIFILLILFLLVLLTKQIFCQEETENRITLELKANIIGIKEVDVIEKNGLIFLPVEETFKFFGIKSSYDSTVQRLEGFYKNPDTSYFIDFRTGNARIARKKFNLTANDFLIKGSNIYLNYEFIKTFFGIDLKYNPRRLRVEAANGKDLPSAKYTMYQRGILRTLAMPTFPAPDSTIGHEVETIAGSRLDWYGTSQFTKNMYLNSRYNLKLGVKLFGGDLSGRFDGYESRHTHRRSLRGNYRYPIFESQYVRQIILGDFISQGVVTREITGMEITNRPFSIRRVFAREVYHGQLDPMMDLTVSSGFVGTQIQHTDEKGTFTFETPLLYGDGLLEMRATDPWGQEKVLRYRESVPTSLIPPSEAEYSLSFGRMRSPSNILMGNSYFKIGLTPSLTTGLIVDYFDLKEREKKIYAGFTATSRIASNIIYYASYIPNAISRSSLNFKFPSSAEIILNHFWYQRNNYFNTSKIIHDINGSISLPLSIKDNRLSLDVFAERRIGNEFRYDEIQAGMSYRLGVIHPRVSHTSSWQKIQNGNLMKVGQLSNFSLSVFMPGGINLWGEGEFNHLRHEFTSFSLTVAKRFRNSFGFAFSYLRMPTVNYSSAVVRFDYYFPFAHTQATASNTGSNNYAYSVNGSGSIGFDFLDRELYFRNRANYAGYGGFSVVPFFDINGNNIQDDSESVITKGKLSYSIAGVPMGMRALMADKLTDDHTFGYDEYLVYLDPHSLENAAWVPRYTSIKILTEPNYIRRVHVPVIIGGFVRGEVKIADDKGTIAEGIKIILTNKDVEKGKYTPIKKTGTTFSTGEFEIGPIAPGKYKVVLDADQLTKLGYRAEPQVREIQVLAKPDGDIIEKVDFRLIRN